MSGNDWHLRNLVCTPIRLFCWLRFLSSGVVFAAVCVSVNADIDSSKPLNIKSQKLSNALIELGAQAEISIVFPSSLPLDDLSPKIDGSYTPAQALDILLVDQAVQWQAFNSRVVALSGKPSAPENRAVFQPTPLTEIIVIGTQVTGSRIKRLDWEGSSPVDIITRAEISARGVQSVSDYLRFIPAVSGNSTSTAVSNGGDGTATITLRGFPSANTLVLLNGRRISNSGFGGDSVDLNSIPLVTVERIEVLKDGASAIYGSDAIAGVVNIILKKEHDGILVDQYFGQTSRGDLSTSHTSIVGGFSTDDASYMINASHFDQGPIYSRDRQLSVDADGRTQGGVDSRSSATPFARIRLSNDPTDPYDDEVVILPGDGSDPSLSNSFRPATSEDRYNYRESTSSMSPSQRTSVFFSAVNDVLESSQIITQASYMETVAQVTFAPLPLFTGFEDPNIVVSSANPFNPFGVDIFDIRRRIVELGPRLQDSREKSQRVATVWENHTNDIHWDVAYNWSTTRAHEDFRGIINLDRTRLALSDSCVADPSCVPLNLFGPPGSISENQLDYIRASDEFSGVSKLYEFTVNADTVIDTWFSDPMDIAGGISRRRENTKLDSKGREFGNTKPPLISGRRSIFEAYLEANIPLLMQKKFAYSLELELATRYSHYSDFGDTNNPKLGLRYRPIADLLVRSTISNGFRAPSLNQLHQDQKLSFDFLDDPCARSENIGLLPGCNQLSDSSVRQFLVETGGNLDLQPETSLSRTIGLVWTPRELSELYLSVDWFWINQDDIIDSRPQFILDQNANGGLSDQVIRDGQGNILRVIASNLNVGSLRVNGIDATIRYQLLNKTYGNLVFSLNASHLSNYLQKLSPSLPSIDLTGTFSDQASAGAGAIPKLKMNTGFSWSNENWEINYSVFFVDELEEAVPFTDESRGIESWTTQNLQMNYLAGRLKNLRLAIGVDNIFDRAPPFSASAFNDNYDPRTYEIKGRNWYAQVRYQF